MSCLDRCVDDGRGDAKRLFVLAGGGGAGDWMLAIVLFGLMAVLVAKQNEFDVQTRSFLHCFVPKPRRVRVWFAGRLRRTSFHGRCALAACSSSLLSFSFLAFGE